MGSSASVESHSTRGPVDPSQQVLHRSSVHSDLSGETHEVSGPSLRLSGGGAGEMSAPTSIRDFSLVKVIGQGAFAKVWHAKRVPRQKSTEGVEDSGHFAIKIQQFSSQKKASKSQERAKEEHLLLQTMDHPFVVKLFWTMEANTESNESFFLVLELVPGGTLFALQSAQPKHRFTEEQTKFYSAEIYLALAYLHSLSITFRDLKPENVLMTASGHIKLTDFGMAKELLSSDERHHSVLGTPQFMAPEIIEHQGYGYPVDFWALGCLVFEMFHSYSPFAHQSMKKMFVTILKADYEEQMTAKMSPEAKDFIKCLLQKMPEDRLTAATAREHPFFRGINWEALFKRHVTPPLVPNMEVSAPATCPTPTHGPEEPVVDDGSGSESSPRDDRESRIFKRSSVHDLTLTESPDEPVKNFAGPSAASGGAFGDQLSLLRRFNVLRSQSCTDRDVWAEILDECLVYTLPSTVYRQQSANVDRGYVKVLVGIDSLVQDLAAGRNRIYCDGQITNLTGELTFTVDSQDVLPTEDGICYSGFIQSTCCNARTAYCCKMMFSTDSDAPGALKIREIEQTLDVLGFAAQFQAAAKEGSDSLGSNGTDDSDVRDGSVDGKDGRYSSELELTDFEVLQMVGSGGFGTVWKARSLRTGVIVALKSQRRPDELIPAAGSASSTEPTANRAPISSGEWWARLKQERDLCFAIKDHPFVVQLLGSFHSTTQVFLVFDFVDGMNLRDLQISLGRGRGEGRLAVETARFVSAEIALALTHVHSHGVIYRDLKPENIVVSAIHGHVKLVDFGLALYECPDIQLKKDPRYAVEGNVEYISPQVLDGELPKREDDWWSFGCLLFEISFGKSPFYESGDIAATNKRIADVHIHEIDPAVLREINESDRPVLLDIVGGAILANRRDRLTGQDVLDHAFFAGVDWEKLLALEVTSPLLDIIATLTSSSDVLLAEISEGPDSFVNDSTSSWQLELTSKFFEHLSRCETDVAAWAQIIQPNVFVCCMPRAPYRAQAASTTVCKRTQLCAVSGIFELVEDMREASDSSKGSVPVAFEMVGGQFYGSQSRAIVKLKLYALRTKEHFVYAAAKCAYDSLSKKITRVETCFDVNAFMHKLDPHGTQQ